MVRTAAALPGSRPRAGPWRDKDHHQESPRSRNESSDHIRTPARKRTRGARPSASGYPRQRYSHVSRIESGEANVKGPRAPRDQPRPSAKGPRPPRDPTSSFCEGTAYASRPHLVLLRGDRVPLATQPRPSAKGPRSPRDPTSSFSEGTVFASRPNLVLQRRDRVPLAT
jgi:hypothetical protein